jgi:hypothetical protein
LLDRAIKFTLVLAVTVFFAVMWGMLLRRHLVLVAPAAFQPSYESLLRPDENERVEHWGVYFVGSRIGQSELKVSRNAEGEIDVVSTTSITIDPALHVLLGLPAKLDVRFEASISPLVGLRNFQVSADSINTRLFGMIVDDKLSIVGHVAAQHITTDLPYSSSVFLGDVFSPFSSLPELSKADVGRSWSVDMVNPLAGGVQHVSVTVGARRQIELDGKRTRVYRQGTPFGLTIRREDLSEEVVRQLLSKEPAVRTG